MPEPENPTVEAPATSPVQGETPATPAFDPEAFKAQLLAEWESKTNKRISDIQSSFQSQINEREEQIRQLKTASMSEEEREQQAEREAAEYVEKLEQQVWLANEASKKYPKATPVLQRIFEANGDVNAIAEALESFLNPAPATPEPVEEVPDVDPNNAPRAAVPAGTPLLPDGTPLTKELASQMLASFGNVSLASLRQRG